MNIKNKLYISATISVIVVVILFSLVLVSSDRIARVSKQLELADDVHRAVSELDLVTYDYLLHREKRMEQQWNSRYDSMGEILEKAEEVDEVELMKSIRADYAALGDLFSQVTANYEERQKLIQEGASQEEIDVNILIEERLVAQLLIKSQSIITDASRLAEGAHAEAREAQELFSTLTLTLMMILAVTITTISLVVARSISKPLDELTKGAEIIGKGNLGHLIESKTKDEVGELATAFNRMTTNLKEITVSRDELNKEVAERKQAEDKAARLNAILGAIRNVNQLIAREKDRDRLIQGVCENLIETRGYKSAWIALVDESRRFLTAAEAGLAKNFSPLVEMMKRGEFTRCGQSVLNQSSIMIVKDVAADCADCPLASTYAGRAGMAIRLEYRDRIYGILSVSTPAEMAADADEQSLFNEVAGDIALALHDIELEEARKRAEEALRRFSEELELKVEERTKEAKEAYRLREHFLKETSHRIITPVAIIGGNTDLLLKSGNLDDDQKEKIRIIRERNEEVQKLTRDALSGKYLKEEEEGDGQEDKL